MKRKRKIVACLYLDNQDQVGYPIEAVFRSVGFADEWVLVASDAANAEHLDALGKIRTQPIIQSLLVSGEKIQSSSDISRAMNTAMRLVFDWNDADAVVLVQADTLSTPEVNAFVPSFVETMDLRHARWLVAADSQLYHRFQAGWGYSIVGREWEGLFHADGLSNMAEFAKNAPTCLHIGLLSTALARRHRRWNAHIWNVPEHIGHIDSLDDEGFVLWHLDHVYTHGRPLQRIESCDARFSRVIDELGLREDQKFVHEMAKRWLAERPWAEVAP